MEEKESLEGLQKENLNKAQTAKAERSSVIRENKENTSHYLNDQSFTRNQQTA